MNGEDINLSSLDQIFGKDNSEKNDTPSDAEFQRESELEKKSEFDELLDGIELDVETDCFEEAIELLGRIEAEMPRGVWAFSPRFYMNRLMAELQCCNDTELAKKYDAMLENSSYKKAKNLSIKHNNTAVLSRLEGIEAKVAEMNEKEAQRLAEKERLAEEERKCKKEEKRLAEECRLAEERKRKEEENICREEETKRKEIKKDFTIFKGVLRKYKGC